MGSVLKKDGREWKIREQVYRDLATGLTFQFETITGDTDGPFRLRVFGNFLFGNREIIFGRDGTVVGGGTFVGGQQPPAP